MFCDYPLYKSAIDTDTDKPSSDKIVGTYTEINAFFYIKSVCLSRRI